MHVLVDHALSMGDLDTSLSLLLALSLLSPSRLRRLGLGRPLLPDLSFFKAGPRRYLRTLFYSGLYQKSRRMPRPSPLGRTPPPSAPASQPANKSVTHAQTLASAASAKSSSPQANGKSNHPGGTCPGDGRCGND